MSLSKSLTAAAGNAAAGDNLYVEDVFSTYLYGGNGTSQAIENGINLGDANVGGSGFVNGAGDRLTTTESLGSGDFTVEFWAYTLTAGDDAFFDTRTVDRNPTGLTFTAINSTTVRIYDSTVRLTVTGISYLNQWVHFAVERSSGTITIYVNGTSGGSVANTTNYSDTAFKIGDSPFYGDTDAYISNFRLVKGSAVYGGNFTPSTAPLTAISGTALLTLQSPEPFTDNSGNSLAITQVGNVKAKNFGPFTSADAGAGGLVWIKKRGSAALKHLLYDTERGVYKDLNTNDTSAEDSAGNNLTAFNSDGFSIGNGVEVSSTSDPRVSWTFRKAEKFFDVQTWTGNSTAGRTIAHNLGSVPACIIVKKTSNVDDWQVYHVGADATAPQDYFLSLNLTDARGDSTVRWNDTAPTDSVFTLGSSSLVNQSGQTYVAYLFASDAGGFGDNGSENIIKCGRFTFQYNQPNEIDVGFEPQFILYKTVGIAGSWTMLDTMRGWTVEGDNWLRANSSDAEGSNFDFMNPTATGFKVNDGAFGEDYIYIAIRRPMKTPESGTEVFAPIAKNSTNPTTDWTVGFPADMFLEGFRTLAGVGQRINTRLTGGSDYLETWRSNATFDGFGGGWDEQDSYSNATGGVTSLIGWFFKRAPGFMDVVAYTGDGVAGRTVSHNLGVVPELMIVKSRSSAEDWLVYHKELNINGDSRPETDYIFLNGAANGGDEASIWNDTSPTDSVFTVGTNSGTNGSTKTYIAYLFSTLAGVSKVGKYIGTGTTLSVDCGFSTGARFILIKRQGTGGWYVWDTARGIIAGPDPYLRLNSTATDVTSNDYIQPLASGFTVQSSAPAELNASGGTYIFLAIA
jgi:hypothetical protein